MSVSFRFCVYEMLLESYLVMDIMRISVLNYIKSPLQRFSNNTRQLSHLLSPKLLNVEETLKSPCRVGRELRTDTCDPDPAAWCGRQYQQSQRERTVAVGTPGHA